MIGLLGRKRGMTAFFDDKGNHTPVTVLAVGPCTVLEVKSREKHKYVALRLAFEQVAEKKLTKADIGQFGSAGLAPFGVVREFRDFPGEHQRGAVLTVALFQKGDRVKVEAKSKGRGYSGVVRRHHFGRPNQTHGTHESFRGSGSVGAHSFPARTWPGQRMAGRLGGKQTTTRNLTIVGVDAERGLMMVKGAVPGAMGGLVSVIKAG